MLKLLTLQKESAIIYIYFKEKNSENIYTKNVKNEEILSLEFELFMVYLQFMSLFIFLERMS